MSYKEYNFKEAIESERLKRMLESEEEHRLREFFGKPVPTLSIPDSLINTINLLNEKGVIDNFYPLYFPKIDIGEGTYYPGWKKSLVKTYWELLQQGVIEAREFGGYWALCETTRKPEYDKRWDEERKDYIEGTQLYDKDFLGGVMIKLRVNKTIPLSVDIAQSSRFGYSHEDVSGIVMPNVAKFLELPSESVRLPNLLEYNYLANRLPLGLGTTSTAEWVADTAREGRAGVFGGYREGGGVGSIGYKSRTGRALPDGLPWIGFRTMIVPK